MMSNVREHLHKAFHQVKSRISSVIDESEETEKYVQIAIDVDPALYSYLQTQARKEQMSEQQLLLKIIQLHRVSKSNLLGSREKLQSRSTHPLFQLDGFTKTLQ